jgi:D-arabinose 1-dehydrogenase-like Zn-dependent alcohol dehydrogenase
VKAAFLTGTREIETRDTPEPTLRGPKDVIVRIEVVGVCGSDIHSCTEGRIGSQIVRFPEIIGHECSGESRQPLEARYGNSQSASEWRLTPQSKKSIALKAE